VAREFRRSKAEKLSEEELISEDVLVFALNDAKPPKMAIRSSLISLFQLFSIE
jgi:hypothetical protein